MSKQKTQTQQTQQQQSQSQNGYDGHSSSDASHTNTYGWESAPINAQTQSVIDAANTERGADPGIQNRYASMEEDVRRSYQDPMGAYTTPFVRGKAQLSQLLKIKTDADKAKREDYFNQQGAQFGQKLAAAQLTNPTLVNTGGESHEAGSTSGSATSSSSSTGSGTSDTTSGKNLFGQLMDFGMEGAAA